jgi:hypothetical protein
VSYPDCEKVLDFVQRTRGCETADAVHGKAVSASWKDAFTVTKLARREDQSEIRHVSRLGHTNIHGLRLLGEGFGFSLWFVTFMVVYNLLLNGDGDRIDRHSACPAQPVVVW